MTSGLEWLVEMEQCSCWCWNHNVNDFEYHNKYKEILRVFENACQPVFLKKLIFFYFLKNYFFYVLDCFNALISKMIFFFKKNIILMYFNMKSILKSNRNLTLKQTLRWRNVSFLLLVSYNLNCRTDGTLSNHIIITKWYDTNQSLIVKLI